MSEGHRLSKLGNQNAKKKEVILRFTEKQFKALGGRRVIGIRGKQLLLRDLKAK